MQRLQGIPAPPAQLRSVQASPGGDPTAARPAFAGRLRRSDGDRLDMPIRHLSNDSDRRAGAQNYPKCLGRRAHIYVSLKA